MAFPTTVDATLSSLECPGKYGSYNTGANRYEILSLITYAGDGSVSAVKLVTVKSTDGGVTWAQVDALGGPDLVPQGPPVYTCCQSTIDDSKLFACFWDNGSFQIGIAQFDCNTDTWSAVLATTSPTAGEYAIHSANGFYVCCHHTASDSVVLALPGDVYNDPVNNILHIVPAFAAYSVAGVSWGAWVTMGTQDYATPIDWKQFPVGIVQVGNNLVLFSQQETSLVSGAVQTAGPYTSNGTFDAPWDVSPTVTAESIGGGGGGASTGPGGGGGGGGYTSAAVSVSPNTTYNVTVGLGGTGATTPAGDGGDSDFDTQAVAGGGKGGGAGTQQTPGAGGAGTQPGGTGGSGTTSGGGGGAGGDANGVGGNGQDGGVTFGGAGGVSPGSSGPGGGGGNAAVAPVAGSPGSAPGGAGGGAGTGVGATGGDGADGQVIITYTLVQGVTYQSRLWQQRINSDLATLGTLSEISQGQFPPRPFTEIDLPMPFDVAVHGTQVAIAFTGSNLTTNEFITVGKGAMADPIAFTFQTFSAGNAGSGQSSFPALAYDGASLICEYCSIPSPPAATFRYRIDTGAGFGSAVLIGNFAGAVTRPQAMNFAASSPEITFGTPTGGSATFSSPG